MTRIVEFANDAVRLLDKPEFADLQILTCPELGECFVVLNLGWFLSPGAKLHRYGPVYKDSLEILARHWRRSVLGGMTMQQRWNDGIDGSKGSEGSRIND